MGIWITQGTASCENGSTSVTGTTTVWSQTKAGDLFRFIGDTDFYEIAADAETNTGLVFVKEYDGESKTDAPFEIVPVSVRRQEVPALYYEVTQLLARLTSITDTTGQPDDSFGSDGSYAIDNNALLIYKKVDGHWNDGTSLGGPGYGGASDTERTIGTGSKQFDIAAGFAWVAGSRAKAIAVGSSPLAWMEGEITEYDEGSLTIDVDSVTGSGTHNSWVFTVTGDKGATGEQGDAGVDGTDGEDGAAATIAVGTVTTLDPGEDATVANAGSSAAAVFNFGIPKGATGDTGPASLVWTGAYDDENAYAANDVVMNEGSSWVCISATTGNTPPSLPTTSNTYWSLLASMGEKGDTGDTGAPGSDGSDGQNFSPDAVGIFDDRDTYDSEAEGFVYLSLDGDGDTITSGVLFFMGGGGSADWSAPVLFQGPTGPAGIIWRGDYSAVFSYTVGDVVSDQGGSWICKTPTLGNAPPTLPTTSDGNWGLLAAPGALSYDDLTGKPTLGTASAEDVEYFAQRFDDKTDLAAASAPSSSAAAIVDGSPFVWDASDLSAEVTADTLEGIYVPPDSASTGASGAWIRKYDGPIHAAWFIDDFSDAYDGLQAAFNEAGGLIESDGPYPRVPNKLILPPGKLIIESGATIRVPRGLHVEGMSRAATWIMHQGGSVPCFDTDSGSTNNIEIRLSNLSIYGADDESTTAGIKFNNAIRNSELTDVDIVRCYDNVVLSDCWTLRMDRCNIRDAVRRNIQAGNLTAASIRDCRIDGAGEYGVLITASTLYTTVHLSFVNSAIQSSQEVGIGLKDVAVAHIEGCYFEGNNKGGAGHADIRTFNTAANTVGTLFNVDNCYGTATGAGGTNSIFVDIERGDLVLKGCYNYNGGNYATGVKLGGNVARFVNLGSRISGTARLSVSSTSTQIVDVMDDNGNLNFGTVSGGKFAATSNGKWLFDSAANRRTELALGSGGTEKWFIGRGDSDEDFPDDFYVHRVSGGTSAPDFRIDDSNGQATFGQRTNWAGTYGGAHPVIGAGHLWRDGSGHLRYKNGAPTGDTEGSVLDGKIRAEARVTLTDDTATSVSIGTGAWATPIIIAGNAITQPAGLLVARAAASANGVTKVLIVGATSNVYTTALTGTTGADVSVNFGADTSGNFYVENRTGSTIAVSLWILEPG